jgi:hypothetical protein
MSRESYLKPFLVRNLIWYEPNNEDINLSVQIGNMFTIVFDCCGLWIDYTPVLRLTHDFLLPAQQFSNQRIDVKCFRMIHCWVFVKARSAPNRHSNFAIVGLGKLVVLKEIVNTKPDKIVRAIWRVQMLPKESTMGPNKSFPMATASVNKPNNPAMRL